MSSATLKPPEPIFQWTPWLFSGSQLAHGTQGPQRNRPVAGAPPPAYTGACPPNTHWPLSRRVLDAVQRLPILRLLPTPSCRLLWC